MTHNPFQYLQPVSPQAFVGRWPLVQQIAANLALAQGDSHAIVAGQRCGKTSLLLTLAQQLCETPCAPGEAWLLPVYVDFKAALLDSAEGIFAYILKAIYRHLKTTVQTVAVPARSLALLRCSRWVEELLNAPTMSQRDFEDGLDYLLTQVATATTPVRLVLLLDQIDQSLDQPWTETFYCQVRNLICSSEWCTRLRLVLTSSPRFLAWNTGNTELCDVIRLHYLEPLDQAGLDQLIAKANITFPLSLREMVWQQSGGQPFLAQSFLAQLWEQSQSIDLPQPDTKCMARTISLALHARGFEFEGWACSLGMVGLAVYRVLCATTEWLTEDAIMAAVDAPAQEVKWGLLALCCQGLVRRAADWACYHYNGDLFKRWFNQCGGAYLPEAEVDAAPVSLPLEKVVSIHIDTGGGPYVAGAVHTQGGGFISRDRLDEANRHTDLPPPTQTTATMPCPRQSQRKQAVRLATHHCMLPQMLH